MATIVVVADDGQGPTVEHIAVKGSDADGAWGQAILMLEVHHPSEEWSKLSSC